MSNQPIDSYSNQPKQPVPNAGGILTLGILSIVLAGLIGLILGIIALSMAGKARAEYEMYPDKYTASSMGNANGGKVCAIIGVCLSVIGILAVFAILAAH
jgi:hypothetical protein